MGDKNEAMMWNTNNSWIDFQKKKWIYHKCMHNIMKSRRTKKSRLKAYFHSTIFSGFQSAYSISKSEIMLRLFFQCFYMLRSKFGSTLTYTHTHIDSMNPILLRLFRIWKIQRIENHRHECVACMQANTHINRIYWKALQRCIILCQRIYNPWRWNANAKIQLSLSLSLSLWVQKHTYKSIL